MVGFGREQAYDASNLVLDDERQDGRIGTDDDHVLQLRTVA
jgi:hypothetical protein